jgi:PD-(D/E)XK endonuclease
VIPVQTQGRSTTAKGDLAEQAVVLALMGAGKTVLKPISNGLRYDLVVDNLDGSFTRVRVKTGMLKRGGSVLAFRAYNADARRPNGVAYQGQVDAFGVYCPWDGRVFFVPMAAVGEITSEPAVAAGAQRPAAGDSARTRL